MGTWTHQDNVTRMVDAAVRNHPHHRLVHTDTGNNHSLSTVEFATRSGHVVTLTASSHGEQGHATVEVVDGRLSYRLDAYPGSGPEGILSSIDDVVRSVVDGKVLDHVREKVHIAEDMLNKKRSRWDRDVTRTVTVHIREDHHEHLVTVVTATDTKRRLIVTASVTENPGLIGMGDGRLRTHLKVRRP